MSERKAKRQRVSASPVAKAVVTPKSLDPRSSLIRRRIVTNVLSNSTFWAQIAQWLELDDVYGLKEAMEQSPIFRGHVSVSDLGSALRTVHIPRILDEKQLVSMNDWLMTRMDKSLQRATPVRALTITDVIYGGGAGHFQAFWTARWINSLYKLDLHVSLSRSEAVFDALNLLTRTLTSSAQLRQLRIVNSWDDEDDAGDVSIDDTKKAVSAFQGFLGHDQPLPHLTSLDLKLFPGEQEELEAPLPSRMDSKRFPAIEDLRLMCTWTKQDVGRLMTEFKSLKFLWLDQWDDSDEEFSGAEMLNLVVKSSIQRLHLARADNVMMHLDKNETHRVLTMDQPLFNTEWTTLVRLIGESDKWSLVNVKIAQDKKEPDGPVNTDTFFGVATAVFHQTKTSIDDLVVETLPDAKSQAKNWIALAHHTKTCAIKTQHTSLTYRYLDAEFELSVSEAKLEPGLESWIRQMSSWSIRSLIISMSTRLLQHNQDQCAGILNGLLDLFDQLVFTQIHRFEIDIQNRYTVELKDMNLFKRFKGMVQLQRVRMDRVIAPQLPDLPYKQLEEFALIVDTPFELGAFHSPRATVLGLTILDRKKRGKPITTRQTNDFLARHPKLKRLVQINLFFD